jgi:hypothetical protein
MLLREGVNRGVNHVPYHCAFIPKRLSRINNVYCVLYEIWASHKVVDEDSSLLACYAVTSHVSALTHCGTTLHWVTFQVSVPTSKKHVVSFFHLSPDWKYFLLSRETYKLMLHLLYLLTFKGQWFSNCGPRAWPPGGGDYFCFVVVSKKEKRIYLILLIHYKMFLWNNGITNIFYSKFHGHFVGCIVVTQELKRVS